MPAPIGNFISQHVYDRRLKTQHEINSLLSCRLVDVRQGKEKSMSKSWVVSNLNVLARFLVLNGVVTEPT